MSETQKVNEADLGSFAAIAGADAMANFKPTSMGTPPAAAKAPEPKSEFTLDSANKGDTK